MSRGWRTVLHLVLVAGAIGSLGILAWPRLAAARRDDAEEACRKRMQILAAAEELHFARSERYTADLRELDPESVSRLSCPVSGEPFVVRSDGLHYTITCPAERAHGGVQDGIPSWE